MKLQVDSLKIYLNTHLRNVEPRKIPAYDIHPKNISLNKVLLWNSTHL